MNKQLIWRVVRPFLRDPVKWVVEKAWPMPPWREALPPYKWEMVFFLGALAIMVGLSCIDWTGALVVSFGTGILLGGMITHRLEEDREEGWGWRRR